MTKKRIGVVQSNYIPWKGYFDIINMSDEFVLYDDCQYTKNDWRNRNQIKTPNGKMWLTIPVKTKDRFGEKIKDIEIADNSWANTHWRTIRQFYSATPFFKEVTDFLEPLYRRAQDERLLTNVNQMFLREICGFMGINAKISTSMEHGQLPEGTATERLIELIRRLDGQIYFSGPSAKGYLDSSQFDDAKIDLRWVSYIGYPEYKQMHGSFEHAVTVLDLLFHTGKDAKSYLLSR